VGHPQGRGEVPLQPGEQQLPAALPRIDALDGLRAVAIVFVLGYHFAVPGFRGGFLGVDLFFTLSGFLITTLLLDERARRGRVGLRGFWSRRARRLLPALFALLIAVAVSARFVTPTSRTRLQSDLVASVLYVTNWHFIAQGHSYFAEYQSPSPLGHLWSLAIEEQFYVVWPLLLGAIAFAARSRRVTISAKRIALVVVATLAIASVVAFALRWERFDPSATYFATDTRAHELLIGALAALVLFPRQAIHRVAPTARGIAAASVAGGVGLGAMVACSSLVSDKSAFYYNGGSVLFSLAAVAAIAGAVFGRGPIRRALSHSLLVYVGTISYGLYLWHWPMTVWLTEDSTHLSRVALLVVRTLATFAVATLSYQLIETPVRYSSRLRFGFETPARAFAVAGLTLMVLAAAIVATADSRPLPSYLEDHATLTVSSRAGARAPTIALVGDSVADSLAPGMAAVARQHGWTTIDAAFPGCAVGELLRVDSDHQLFGGSARCVEKAPGQQRVLVRRYHPRVILWYSARERYDVLWHGKVVAGGTSRWRSLVFADWDKTLHRLRAGGAQIAVVLPAFSVGQVSHDCVAKDPAPTCSHSAYLGQGLLRRFYQQWAALHRSELTVIDMDSILCTAHVPCPALTYAGAPVRDDGLHFSTVGARWVAERVVARMPAMHSVR
jgi:peptidoglycan/LPS O-acetylase OafA/YrhL